MSTLTLFYQDVQKISGYTVVEEIHAKSTTRIYKVRANSEYFALKIVDQSSKPQRIQRFKRELQFLQLFASVSGVPCVYKYGNIHNNPYYVMEYVEGSSLTACAKKCLAEREALQIIKNLCVVVKQIHEKQVLHCNLSPANILLSQNQVFVIGFGSCVRCVELTQSTDIVGRLHYLSPEQVNGNIEKLGPWSDTYSLGAILYFLLTANAPFDAPSEVEVIHNLATCNLRSVKDYGIQISQKCQSIVERALSQDISDRYQSMNELLIDVMCCMDIQGSSNATIVQQNIDPSAIFREEPQNSSSQATKPFAINDLPPLPDDLSLVDRFAMNDLPPIANDLPLVDQFVERDPLPVVSESLPNFSPTIDVADENKALLPVTENKFVEKSVAKEAPKRPRTKTRRYSKMPAEKPRHRKNSAPSKSHMPLLLSFSIGIAISLVFVYPFLGKRTTSQTNNDIKKPGIEKTVAIEEKEKPQKDKTPQISAPTQKSEYQKLSKVSSLYNARWRLQNGIWVGTAQKSFGLMTISDFPNWKNYEFKADVLIKEGRLGIFVRNFTQTAQFPNFLGQMGIFPHKNRWFSVTATVRGNQLLIQVDNTDRRLTRFSIPSANPGVVGFGLAIERANKNALAYVKNIRMKKLP
ncbi:serine/threonine protein kinase [Candidatus Uabimicrobium amorphum]|uniref:Serine/threonine protein kinase n=1 Tax=Uabimicrobium amorphum TaxID=2596890 RepID=A0A5S9F2R7_UABAM|nr:serine/threonine-protein kinase [Candidatus Uabimicrobium amorphum]BBM83762.1 serine/threonine protein kinase [Candidatus Uabimicrobium amorphum]